MEPTIKSRKLGKSRSTAPNKAKKLRINLSLSERTIEQGNEIKEKLQRNSFTNVVEVVIGAEYARLFPKAA